MDAEIIVSDYGSQLPVRHQVEELGAKYVYTDTAEPWSRSRALNAGLQQASGSVLVTTDADMVFSPHTFEIVLRRLNEDTNQFALMQCRDLPAGITHAHVNNGDVTWEQLRRMSAYRPRWGMGGMIAVPRWAYERLRGLDERMIIYGGEDIDFAKRMRRLGLRMTWIDSPNAMMFHIWHPSSRNAADGTPEGRKAIATNRAIHLNDKSSIRNLDEWRSSPKAKAPLISIVVSTFNRADYLNDCILSILSQTVTDWELLVIDDGSSDHTRQIVDSHADSRIRYYYQPNAGLAAARNWGTDLARGQYIAVHDDDDLMLPDRLEASLSAVTEGAVGAYGGWIDYDERTGARSFHTGKKLSLESLLFNSGVYLHPTLLVETRVLKSVRYDATFRSGSDYNLAIRLQRAGVKLNHCGKYVTMRRQHDGQITSVDDHLQKTTGALSAVFGRSNMSWSDTKAARLNRGERDKAAIQAQKYVEPAILQFLPDSTVQRAAVVDVHLDATPKPTTERILKTGVESTLQGSDGRPVTRKVFIRDLKLRDLYKLLADRACAVKVETKTLYEEAEMSIAPYVKLSIEDRSFDHQGLTDAYVASHLMKNQAKDITVVHTNYPKATVKACDAVPNARVVDILTHKNTNNPSPTACVILIDNTGSFGATIWNALRTASRRPSRISTYRIED
ncbi:glycosyltransferase [Brevibacterium luteolum]|nr:glycosyltransferase [Brevibacterium luteolum]